MSGEEYGLVMPFVVCGDNGYDAASFVAGIYLGEAEAILRLAPFGVLYRRYVPPELVPQLDLLAMREGCHLKATPWAEYPDEWTYVEIQKPSFTEEETTP